MKTNKNWKKKIDFDDYLKKHSRSGVFKREFKNETKTMALAFKLSHIRESKGMTQKEVARKLSMEQSNIARIESGRQNFTIEMLEKLAKVYGKEVIIDFK